MQLKRYFQRILPKHHELREHKHLRLLGNILNDPNIFHLTRRSVAGGVATGLFVGFLPFPGHMPLAALMAVLFRVNLPLAVVLVWVSNPITIPPIFYFAYKTGARLLNLPHRPLHFEPTWAWFSATVSDIWLPLLLGSLLFSIVAAMIGYLAMQLLWRLAIVRKWEERKKAKLKKAGKTPPG